MLTPISLLFGLLLGILALAFPLLGILLLYRALRRPSRVLTNRNNRDIRTYAVAEHSHPVRQRTWRERLREPSVLIPLIAGTLLLLFTFTGGHLIRLSTR